MEESVEKPSDGLNGDCIVHYGGERSKYKMRVQLVQGKREGVATITNDGMPYLRVEYNGGSMTGMIERLNEYGTVDLRGHLVDGIEDGLFEEYDKDERVVWTGYYRNGKKDTEVHNRIVKKGSGSNEFYELDENGQPTHLCLYENGKKSQVLARFNGSTMTEFDMNGKRVYEGEYKGDTNNGHVREGKGKEFENGGETVVYSGDWKNGKREGFGTEFNDAAAVYTGEWRDGKRNGNGKEMDKNGKVVRSGRWVNGVNEVIIPSSLTSNPLELVALEVGSNSYNNSGVTELKLSGLARLKRIVIGEECFESVRVIKLDGLGELESVVIGEKSFTYAKTDDDIRNNEKRTDGVCQIMNCLKLKSIQIGDRSFLDYYSFELINLPSLQSIETGYYCFRYVPSFSLTGLSD